MRNVNVEHSSHQYNKDEWACGRQSCLHMLGNLPSVTKISTLDVPTLLCFSIISFWYRRYCYNSSPRLVGTDVLLESWLRWRCDLHCQLVRIFLGLVGMMMMLLCCSAALAVVTSAAGLISQARQTAGWPPLPCAVCAPPLGPRRRILGRVALLFVLDLLLPVR